MDLEHVENPALLRAVAGTLEKEVPRLHGVIVALKRETETLKGASPEAVAIQAELLEKTLTETTHHYAYGSERRPRAKKPEVPRAPQTGHGPTPQPQLPIEVVEHELDEADRVCTSCGGHLAEWAGQHDESEEVDVLELKYVLKKHVRKKYRCQCGGCVETALGPTKLVPGGRYSAAFAIQVAVDKYDGHLPLERRARRMRRAGLDVKSQTLWDQTFVLAGKFRDAAERLHKYLLGKELLLADESRWPLLGAKGRKTKNWFAWTLASNAAILHKILDTRANAAGAEVLRDFSGVLMTDGYAVYRSQSKKLGYTQAHCWAHARRNLDAFRIDRTEVTVAQYRACVDDGVCRAADTVGSCNWGKSGRDGHPINCVDWKQARNYCRWAGKRLPTEAQWEKAARGTDRRFYPWGNARPSCRYVVMNDGGRGCGTGSTMPVGSKPDGAGPYGALDMSGNVWEWVADRYAEDAYRSAGDRNPTGPSSGGSDRAFRGGSWNVIRAQHLRASHRLSVGPGYWNDFLGFRCVRPSV